MRFLYAVVAALGWLILYAKLGLPVENNTVWITTAIIMAGAMAGGD